MTEPIHIDPDAAYSRGLLKEAVCDPLGIDVDTFLSRLKPRKVFRGAWLGSDVLNAWRAAAPLEERAKPPKAKGRRKRATGFTPEELGISK